MSVMAAAFDCLKAGKRTYGPFSPATDRRDLRCEAEEELLDAIVYAYLAILRLEAAGTCASRRDGYHLVLVPLPGNPPPEIRLRQGPELLLRRFRLRCVSVNRFEPSEPRLDPWEREEREKLEAETAFQRAALPPEAWSGDPLPDEDEPVEEVSGLCR